MLADKIAKWRAVGLDEIVYSSVMPDSLEGDS